VARRNLPIAVARKFGALPDAALKRVVFLDYTANRGGDFPDRGGGRPWLPGGANKMANLEHPPETRVSGDVSRALRVTAIVLRTLFIALLLVLTLRVSLPQSETIWTAYDTPADLVRLILGVGVCAWLVYQLFLFPKDAESSRTWFYLGLVAVPFTLVVLFVAW
jgi:hypothetical protein